MTAMSRWERAKVKASCCDWSRFSLNSLMSAAPETNDQIQIKRYYHKSAILGLQDIGLWGSK